MCQFGNRGSQKGTAMKLTTQDTSHLLSILSTCAVGGIESIIIENGIVRGVYEARTFAIISDYNIPKFPQKIGLSRLSSLKQRIDLFSGAAVVEAKESERGEISSIEISEGKNKVQYRCTSTMLIKAPKSINGFEPDQHAYRVFLTREEMKIILNAIKAMAGTNVELIIKKDRVVTINLSDTTNDVFTTVLENPAELLGEEQDSVVHYYHTDIFYSVIKQNSNCDISAFTVGNIGTIRAQI